MSMIAVCDGCGKQEPADCVRGAWVKPEEWFERTPIDPSTRVQLRTITACSRECVYKIMEKEKTA